MATKLTKTLARETAAAWQGRRLIVELHPAGVDDKGRLPAPLPDRITVREKGRRRGYSLAVLTAYIVAAREFAAAEKQRQAAERKARRAAR